MILENIDQGVVLFDRDLRVVAYNRRLADWLQIGSDLRGMSYDDVVRLWRNGASTERATPRRRSPYRRELVRSGKRFVGERKRSDGRTVSVTYNPLPGGGGVMTYSDVTEARDARGAPGGERSAVPLPVQALTHADVGL